MIRNTSLDRFKENITFDRKINAIGIVSNVYPNLTLERESSVRLDVQFRDGRAKYEKVPLRSQHNGHHSVPQPGDMVMMEFLSSTGQEPVVTGFFHNDEILPPLVDAGHYRHEFRRDNESDDPLYLEAERVDHSAGDPNVVRMAQKPDGLSDTTTTVEIDDSSDTTVVNVITDGEVNIEAAENVNVHATGDTHIDADGDIYIGDKSLAEQIPDQGHTHTVSDTQDDGSVITRTTSNAGSESTTNTYVE